MHVVAGVDDLVEAPDVIAVLVAGDHVVEAARGVDPEGLQIGHDVVRAHPGLPALEENGRSVGTDDEDGASPFDIDVVDLKVLGKEGQGEDEEREREQCALHTEFSYRDRLTAEMHEPSERGHSDGWRSFGFLAVPGPGSPPDSAVDHPSERPGR